MTIAEGGVYRDALGRRWKAVQVLREYDGLVMIVRRAWRPWSEIQAAVVDEHRPDTATITTDGESTILYAEEA